MTHRIVHLFKSMRFRTKLSVLASTTVAVASLLSCAGLIGVQYKSEGEAATRRHAQIIRVIASNIGAALVFRDTDAARENLTSVATIPDIRWIMAYDARGALVSEFQTGAAKMQASGSVDTVIRQAVTVDGDRVGELRMAVTRRTMSEILRATMPMALAIFAASLVLSMTISRWLGQIAYRPIDRLLLAMRRIIQSSDYTTRVLPEADPDFETIVTSFNAMLDEVAKRNLTLLESADKLRTARDEARQANIAKSHFLANMSHELRTPLNAIIGYTEILQEDLTAAGDQRSIDDVGWIYSSAQQLLSVINDILDLSKIESGRSIVDAHEFDVGVLLHEIGHMLEPIAANKNNVLHISVGPGLPIADTDSVKLRQCLLNLGSNACKFTTGGCIVIAVRADGEDLIFTVSDTGIGIGEDAAKRLFQPFVQADASTSRLYGGTGLGLAITARFAAMLEGSVEVESTLGKGSTFTLRIKATIRKASDLPDKGPTIDHPIARRADRRPLALIVDDEPSALQLLSRLAELAGYATSLATDGEQGIIAARRLRPELILLDIGMPRVDGWQVLASLASDAELSSIPTVVVTVDDQRRRALEAGASEHLIKPVSRQALANVLQLYASKGKGQVLIVEDDAATASLYARGFRNLGYEVQVVGDGRAAVVELGRTTFDFVITDLRMPQIDGFELVDLIAAIDADIRPQVIVVTGKILDECEMLRLQGKISKLLSKNGLSPHGLAHNVREAEISIAQQAAIGN